MEPGDRLPRSGSCLAVGLAAALLAATLVAVPATAQNTTQITIEAREDCTGDETFCFDVTGDLEDLEPGDVLDIRFENPEDNVQSHNVYIADSGDANVGTEESTPGDRAFANTDDVSPGNETAISTEIPSNAEAIYLWCTVRAHEQQGMFVETELAGTEETGGENGSPGFTALASVLAVAAVGALARDR